MNLKDLVPFVQQQVPTVNVVVATVALHDAVYSFMRDTYLFRDQCEIKGQSCVREYEILIPECRDLVWVDVQNVTVNGFKAHCNRDLDEDVLVFHYDVPDCACIVVPYAWAIMGKECEIPDRIYTRYKEPIVAKALSQIFSIDGRPWQDMQRSVYELAVYTEFVEGVHARSLRQFSNQRRMATNPYR